MLRSYFCSIFAAVLIILLQVGGTAVSATTLTGLLIDSETDKPIPRVTVQQLSSGNSTLTNDQGRFRLVSDTETLTLKFTHVGYHSQELKIVSAGEQQPIFLKPATYLISGIRVYENQYDPAQQIIIEAIRRKTDILNRVSNYKNDAYVKFVVRDVIDTDSSKIFIITESQTTAYWESPDHYKEIVTGRKQSANLKPENNFVAVGELLNFNNNRIDIGEYEIVSPTAHDALKYYNYYLLDTIRLDATIRFLLEVEPKDPTKPLFEGTIQIVDSTFDVVLVDVGLSKGVAIPLVSNLRFQQQMFLLENKYWTPLVISFSGDVSIKAPLPGIPSNLSFEYIASLYSFEFDQSLPPGIFDDYEFVIAETADDIDSTGWQANQRIELTSEELVGYARIDSVEHAPTSISKKLLTGFGGAAALMMGTAPELFHFNRVEGTYFGFGLRSRKLIKHTTIWAGGGYAHELADWQYHFGFERKLWDKLKLNLNVEFKDKLNSKPSMTTSANSNVSVLALMAKLDPNDYYREKGFQAGLSFRPFKHNRVGIGYNHYEQRTAQANNDYSFFGEDSTRVNPAIIDGDLRSIDAFWKFDSRSLINNKGFISPGFERVYYIIKAEGEIASTDFAGNDFNFRQIRLSFETHMRLVGSSKTSIYSELGYSDRSLPPQRFYGVDFGTGLVLSEKGFNTLGDSLFFGDRVATVYLTHDFGRQALSRSPLPLLNKLDFGLSIHGGAFWSSFKKSTFVPEGNHRTATHTPYSEIGFVLYNLTPFISPLNLAAGFTWQLSNYDTNDFFFNIGLQL